MHFASEVGRCGFSSSPAATRLLIIIIVPGGQRRLRKSLPDVAGDQPTTLILYNVYFTNYCSIIVTTRPAGSRSRWSPTHTDPNFGVQSFVCLSVRCLRDGSPSRRRRASLPEESSTRNHFRPSSPFPYESNTELLRYH